MADNQDQDLVSEPEQAEPEYTGTDLHPAQVEGYEPKFDRTSTTRRVLGHVTDEVDIDALGPRNTLDVIAYGLFTDDNTPAIGGTAFARRGTLSDAAVSTQQELDKLVDAGLLERDGDHYVVTDAGLTELRN